MEVAYSMFLVSLEMKPKSSRKSGDFDGSELASIMNDLVLHYGWDVKGKFFPEELTIVSEEESPAVVFKIKNVLRQDREFIMDILRKQYPTGLNFVHSDFQKIKFLNSRPIAANNSSMYTSDEMLKIGIVGIHGNSLCIIDDGRYTMAELSAVFRCFGNLLKAGDVEMLFDDRLKLKKFVFPRKEAATSALRILNNPIFNLRFVRARRTIEYQDFVPVSADTRLKEAEYMQNVRQALGL